MRALFALSFASFAALGPLTAPPSALAAPAAPSRVPAAAPARASSAPAPTRAAQLLAAYPKAQLALARAHQTAHRAQAAQAAAESARQAADRQLELHKSLSEVALTYEQVRAERAAAREAGLLRDEASFLLGELAQARGETDPAIQHFVEVVSSQPDTPLGARAFEALRSLGFAASPLPATPAPKGS